MTLPDKQTLEREVKLSVTRHFVLPQLPGEPLPPQVFTSTYFDTENYQLAQAGVTLRYRAESGVVITFQFRYLGQPGGVENAQNPGTGERPRARFGN